MIRLASLFWLVLVAVTGFATFKVKYAVQDIEDELEPGPQADDRRAAGNPRPRRNGPT